MKKEKEKIKQEIFTKVFKKYKSRERNCEALKRWTKKHIKEFAIVYLDLFRDPGILVKYRQWNNIPI